MVKIYREKGVEDNAFSIPEAHGGGMFLAAMGEFSSCDARMTASSGVSRENEVDT